MSSRFDSLPNEIQQQVLTDLYNSISDVRGYISVCGSWNNFFQNILYADVTIHSFLQLSKFLHTLETTQQLSSLVKRLTVCFTVDYEDEVKNSTITRLFSYLPNLEYIDCSNTIFLEFILDALSANQLPNLNHIEPPYYEEDLADYIECAIILKDRLTHLSIKDPSAGDEVGDDDEDLTHANEGSKMFYRLFLILNEFKKVGYLSIHKRCSNDILMLEEAIKMCPLLERLNYDCILPESNDQVIYLTHNKEIEISNTLPAPNISHLTFQKNAFIDRQFIDYITYKFPGLKKLEIFGQAADRSFYLDELKFKIFLDYLSKLRYVNIQSIFYKDQTLIDSIGPFWKAMSVSRTVSIEFRYNSIYSEIDELAVLIDDSLNSNIIRYSRPKSDLNYSEVIAKYGKYFGRLAVYKAPGSLHGNTLYELLILLPLKYCIKLKQLSILGSTIAGLNVPDYGVIRRQTFDSLSFIACTIEDNVVFERLSELFAYINYVDLYAIRYLNRDRNSLIMNIHMKETEVGTLVLSTKALFSNSRRNHILLIKLSTNQNYSYYMYDIEATYDLELKKLDDQAFNNALDHGKCFMIDLSFQSLGSLKINHYERELALPNITQ